jgi:hypothetical protein
MGQLGFGRVTILESMGTANPNSRLPNGQPSEHAASPPRAIDISGVKFENGMVVRTQGFAANPVQHLQVEACLRFHFGLVLGPHDNAAHVSHWHCDNSIGVGGARSSQDGFALRAAKALGYADVRAAQAGLGVAVDGDVGPQTLHALCQAVVSMAKTDGVKQSQNVVIVRGHEIPYMMVGGVAYGPIRAMAEARGDTVNASGFPEKIVVVEGSK